MNLKVFGDLALEKDGVLHQKPYIALLALCYIAIEGKTDREELVNLVQAADKNRFSRMSRNDTEEISESERTRQDEIYKKSRNNFRQSIFQLKKSVGEELPKDIDYLNYLIRQESTLICDYHKAIELFQGTTAEQLEAIALYEQGQFLGYFETRYPKRHLAVAEELKLWVHDKRSELLSLYLKAKSEHNTEVLTLKDLEKQLPKDAGGAALSISAETIVKLGSETYDLKEKQSCLNYLEDYIQIHIADVVGEEANRELTFKVLEVLCLVKPPDILLAKNSFSINDDVLIGIVDDLQEDGWLADDSSSGQVLGEPRGKTLVINRLNRSYSEHLDLIFNLCQHASIEQKRQLLQNLISHHVIQENDYIAVTKLVNQTCHQLINEQNFDKAIKLSQLLIDKSIENKIEYQIELGFWHSYALERNSDFEGANTLLKDLIKKVDEEEQEDLFDRLNALRVSVLTRIAKGNRELKRTKKIAEEVLEGSSDWASAEALNTLGRLSFALDENLIQTKQYFNKASVLWESLGETIRQIGAMSNLAAILDRNKLIDEAEEAYDKAFEKAKEKKLYGDVWVRLLLNRATFYQESIINNVAPNPQEFTKKATKYINILKADLASEDISPYVKAHAYQNIGLYHEELNEHDIAVDFYKQALEIGREAQLVKTQGISMVNIGLLTQDFDLVEVGIQDFLKKGGFLEDAEYCRGLYLTLLKNLQRDKKQSETLFKELEFRIAQFTTKKDI